MFFDVETFGVKSSSDFPNNWEKAVLILAGNLNSGLSYLITTVIEKSQEYIKDSLFKKGYKSSNSEEASYS